MTVILYEYTLVVSLQTANAASVRKSGEKNRSRNIYRETVIMELIESGEDSNEMKGLIYDKVSSFKYLGATLSTKNDWAKEISIRINKSQKAVYTLTKFLTSKMSKL